MRSANEKFPELKNIETLPAHEMAVRLCFLFDHYDRHPPCEDAPGCAHSPCFPLSQRLLLAVSCFGWCQLLSVCKHAPGDTVFGAASECPLCMKHASP
jgi:hypothetical protein